MTDPRHKQTEDRATCRIDVRRPDRAAGDGSFGPAAVGRPGGTSLLPPVHVSARGLALDAVQGATVRGDAADPLRGCRRPRTVPNDWTSCPAKSTASAAARALRFLGCGCSWRFQRVRLSARP